MLHVGKGIFLQIPGKMAHRVLYPARVMDIEDKKNLVEMTDLSGPGFVTEQNIVIYSELNRRFAKQDAKIDSVTQHESGLQIEFETQTDPVDADDRQHYRVSTVMADQRVELGGNCGCILLDVSAAGLSAASDTKHNVGDVLVVSFSFENKTYSGTVCVQSVRAFDACTMRYGMRCTSESAGTGELAKGLSSISMATQRKQLRRLAGTA